MKLFVIRYLLIVIRNGNCFYILPIVRPSTILQTPIQVNYLLGQPTSQLTLIIESTIFESMQCPGIKSINFEERTWHE